MAVTRREILVTGVGLAGLAMTGCATSPTTGGRPIPVPGATAPPGSPNLLVLFSDDHRADHLGITGEVPFLQTPALEALAMNCFC